MRLTSFSDLAFRVLLYAAAHRERLFTIDEMNKYYSTSRAHLTKVVNALTRAGYLKAVRGRAGGLTLAMEPNLINLADVVKMTESDFKLVECMHSNSQCAIEQACKIPKPLNEAIEAFLAKLAEYTLEDIKLEARIFTNQERKAM